MRLGTSQDSTNQPLMPGSGKDPRGRRESHWRSHRQPLSRGRAGPGRQGTQLCRLSGPLSQARCRRSPYVYRTEGRPEPTEVYSVVVTTAKTRVEAPGRTAYWETSRGRCGDACGRGRGSGRGRGAGPTAGWAEALAAAAPGCSPGSQPQAAESASGAASPPGGLWRAHSPLPASVRWGTASLPRGSGTLSWFGPLEWEVNSSGTWLLTLLKRQLFEGRDVETEAGKEQQAVGGSGLGAGQGEGAPRAAGEAGKSGARDAPSPSTRSQRQVRPPPGQAQRLRAGPGRAPHSPGLPSPRRVLRRGGLQANPSAPRSPSVPVWNAGFGLRGSCVAGAGTDHPERGRGWKSGTAFGQRTFPLGATR